MAVNNIAIQKNVQGKYLYAAPTAKDPNTSGEKNLIKAFNRWVWKTTEVVQGTTTAAQLEKYNQEHSGNPTKIRLYKSRFSTNYEPLNDGKFDYKIFDKIGVETVIKNQKLIT